MNYILTLKMSISISFQQFLSNQTQQHTRIITVKWGWSNHGRRGDETQKSDLCQTRILAWKNQPSHLTL